VSPSYVYFGIQEILTLSKEGLWLSNGEEVTHDASIRAFFRGLTQDPQGRWVVRIGREEKEVTVEDTPSFVQRLSGSPDLGYRIHLLFSENSGGEELQVESLRYRQGRLTCRTAQGWEARFLRAPYHEILAGLQKDDQGYFLKIKGARIDLKTDS
jgi:hypothetical protein